MVQVDRRKYPRIYEEEWMEGKLKSVAKSMMGNEVFKLGAKSEKMQKNKDESWESFKKFLCEMDEMIGKKLIGRDKRNNRGGWDE